jgi:phosphatidylserine/phosphatidylglycerophosphate/cardiolipin synthase-like enzyme
VVDAFHVDHRKIVTIDGRIAYCGSANFEAQYQYHRPFDPTKPAEDEADAARAAGEPEPCWRLGGGADFVCLEADLGTSPRGVRVRSARVLKNEPSSRTNEIREIFVERILSAQRTVFIENPFLYHPTIVEMLLAAKRACPLSSRDAHRAGARMEPEQVHARRAATSLHVILGGRDRCLRVPEPLQPSEARDIRRKDGRSSGQRT